MDQHVASFLNQLSAISSGVLVCYHDTVAYWDPDEPPDTILLADLGRRIVEEFPSVGDAVNDRLFSEIERAMASDDELLATVVASSRERGKCGASRFIRATGATPDRISDTSDPLRITPYRAA